MDRFDLLYQVVRKAQVVGSVCQVALLPAIAAATKVDAGRVYVFVVASNGQFSGNLRIGTTFQSVAYQTDGIVVVVIVVAIVVVCVEYIVGTVGVGMLPIHDKKIAIVCFHSGSFVPLELVEEFAAACDLRGFTTVKPGNFEQDVRVSRTSAVHGCFSIQRSDDCLKMIIFGPPRGLEFALDKRMRHSCTPCISFSRHGWQGRNPVSRALV
mmetsp:Transcript_4022/g.8659  ORF Transcript_4022/g.8659 Transcript_4022/m.8659 type:complete len:211 (+) Transcript_4022:844-1476(+)